MLQNIIQSIMRQVQGKMPQGFQVAQQIMNNGQNPEPYIKQMLGHMTDEQKQNLFKQAKGYGMPDEILSKFQNMR